LLNSFNYTKAIRTKNSAFHNGGWAIPLHGEGVVEELPGGVEGHGGGVVHVLHHLLEPSKHVTAATLAHAAHIERLCNNTEHLFTIPFWTQNRCSLNK